MAHVSWKPLLELHDFMQAERRRKAEKWDTGRRSKPPEL